MEPYDVKQIMVDGRRTGIIGLEAALQAVAEEYAGRADSEIEAELLKRLSKHNYIYEKAEDQYGRAFLREYKKFVGEPFQEESFDGLQIKVLGPGCPNCHRLEQDLMTLAAETRIPADIEHVTDLKEIGHYGVMATPALIINGKVMAVGNVPPKSRLKEWLLRAGDTAKKD